jgi:glycosyltransferase involved in cell wall biosynthesis
MRLAWFSPMPPVRTGIAACSAELVAALRSHHDVDVFVDRPGSSGAGDARPAHDFVWEQRRRRYDLTVFQLGNSSHHDYQWPYLFRYPGLAVLHDAHLHHARAAQLLRERRSRDYRVEFAANEPDANPAAAELAIAGFDSYLHYQWPFNRLVCTASRMAAVHSRSMCDELRSQMPDARIEHVRLGHGTFVSDAEIDGRRARARARYGIPDTAAVFGCFGGLTPEKRVPQILDAFGAVQAHAPLVHLLLAGSTAEHYDVRSDVTRRGLESSVTVAGYVETDDRLTDVIAACDVTLNLRWPTARETSGPWLRCLAAGRASIVIDLSHMADVPSIDPRTWTSTATDGAAPVTVALDILDEDHSLRRAMRRLAIDAVLRKALGRAARDFWMKEHSEAAMLADYERLLPEAARAVPASRTLPAHARSDQSQLMESILGGFGVPVPWSKI